MIRLYTAAYGNSGMNARQVLEEMVCDAMGKMNAFATEETSTVAGEVGQFLRDLRKEALETQTDGQKNSAQEGVKFSREIFDNAARQFDNEISQWDNDGRDGDRQFILGTTGEILQGLGAVENDIYMNGDKINTILEEHPEMTLSEIKQIPQILNDPTLILKSRNVGRRGSQNTRMVLFGTAKAQNNLPIMVIFDVRPTEGHFVVTDMQKVTSAYTKTTDAVGFVKNSFVMYADKKRATPLLRTIGFHTPIELRQGGYVGSIAYNKQNVNLYGEEFSNVFREGTTKYSRELDSEYMELAKDPEGNSTELRKMVDQAAEQQGYKTLFYHGSKKGGGFTEFRDWQYFTPKKEYAERYAQRGNPDSLYSVFVKMENPFDTRNAKARRIFQEARDELGLGEIQDTGLPDWTDGYDLADYIDENGLNYDAIVLDEGGDLVNGKPVSRGLSYVVRKSNQVKSADAVVYDDNGKVIPLSERFNSDKRDIRYSRELELDSEGNALTQEQTDFFADSEVRNDDGELIPVYHKTTESFTVFQRGKLGKETLGNADDASLAATSLIGHWFSDSENTPFMGDAMKTYLNIKNPYYTSLDELAADMGDFSGDLEMMQDHFDRGQYNMVREAARSYVRWMKWKGYDGLIVNDTETGGTSYVILNSNQAKLTDNGNPTSKRDIRYSRELETVEALKRQNEILQKQRDYWKEQTRTTDEKTRGADKGEVRSLAGQLIRQYSSKTEVEEILPEMQWLADSIWRNDPKISYTDLQDSAQNIARMVLDGSEVNLNAENWETGQELKRFLRGRYINVDESLKENIGDFKNFKRSNRSLHFRENGTGTGVASLWLELQNDFGKGLFPDSISNPGDQIRHIADTLTSLTESDIQNPYAADMELTVEQMAADVMARAAGVNRQKATKADNTADSPLLYSVRMLTWAEVSWSMLPSS